VLSSTTAFCQLASVEFSAQDKGSSLVDILALKEKQYDIKIFFTPEWLQGVTVQKNYKGVLLAEALKDILANTPISFVMLYDRYLVFVKDPSGEMYQNYLINTAKELGKDINQISLGEEDVLNRKERYRITGKVLDSETGNALVGATISVNDLNIAVQTDQDGKFQVDLPSGSKAIAVQYLNYVEQVVILKVFKDGDITIKLSEVPRMLSEVVVTDQRQDVALNQIGKVNIKLAELKQMPAFLGEVDIIKQIQTLPGVTSVGEVSSGFNVRGGGVDQNLILYDGVPVFNNAHVLGFFTAFNAEAIGNASFYKAGIPAEYGGRVSSVLTIDSKRGKLQKWETSGGLGLISSAIATSGPIVKNKTSLSASFRSSYSDWLLKTFTTKYNDIKNSSVFFYDLATTINHRFNDKNMLSASIYMSQDKFGLPSDTTYRWQNRVYSVQYDHIFNEKLTSAFTIGYGEYSYDVTDEDPSTAYTLKYSIQYPTIKAAFTYNWKAHKITAGVNSLYYMLKPGQLTPGTDESSVLRIHMNEQRSMENAIFISDDLEFTEKLHLEIGARLSYYLNIGPGTVNHYEPDGPMTNETRTSSKSYAKGEVINTYNGIEPRASIRYSLPGESSVKIGYNRIYQYIHLISNSAAVTPIDIWQPSNVYLRPQIGNQVSAGYYRHTPSNKYDFSLETFYKTIDNSLDYKDGANLVLNPALETVLLRGITKCYGIEAAVNKNLGRLLGGVNYTYSRSLRKVDGKYEGESINDGNYYPSNYDQPHIVNLNWRYGLSKRFTFTGNFTYHTGRPVTVPTSTTIVDNVPIVNFSDRNEYRVPDYHRLDLALVITGSHKRHKFWDGSWILSVYNVYARKNVYTVFYQKDANGIQQPYKMSIVGTALPSLTYKFKF